MDEGSKVRILNRGIQTDKLNNVKTQILANPALQNGFDAYVTLYKDFISQTKSDGNDTLNISQVKRTMIPGRASTRIRLGRRARV